MWLQNKKKKKKLQAISEIWHDAKNRISHTQHCLPVLVTSGTWTNPDTVHFTPNTKPHWNHSNFYSHMWPGWSYITEIKLASYLLHSNNSGNRIIVNYGHNRHYFNDDISHDYRPPIPRRSHSGYTWEYHNIAWLSQVVVVEAWYRADLWCLHAIVQNVNATATHHHFPRRVGCRYSVRHTQITPC